MYAEKYKTLLNKIKDLNKWKDIFYPWSRKQYYSNGNIPLLKKKKKKGVYMLYLNVRKNKSKNFLAFLTINEI